VRYVAAWGFVAVFWILAFLSDALLELVEIRTIETLMRLDWLRFTVTGALLGLGLAVVYELRAMISPYLILRLLRLTVPLVLVVVGIFVAAVPLRGLSDLFGGFSAAGTLMGTAIAAITLISAALDRDDTQAVSTPGLRGATQGLALLLPALAALALVAVGLRVGQYGWTPDRVLAAAVAVFLLAYALGYAGSVLLRRGWAARIRGCNTVMALAVIAGTALWMTPALDAYRVSANSQAARHLEGGVALDRLPLWQMAHDWGRAGEAALDRLAAGTDAESRAALDERLTTLREMPNAFQYEQAIACRARPDQAAALAAILPLRPEGTEIDPLTLAGLPPYRLTQVLEGCRRPLPDGRPGCVLLMGGFAPSAGADDRGCFSTWTPMARPWSITCFWARAVESRCARSTTRWPTAGRACPQARWRRCSTATTTSAPRACRRCTWAARFWCPPTEAGAPPRPPGLPRTAGALFATPDIDSGAASP